MKNTLALKLDAYRRLGLPSLIRAVIYKLLLRHHLHPVQYLKYSLPVGHYFDLPDQYCGELRDVFAWIKFQEYFGWLKKDISDAPPDWYENAVTGQSVTNPERPWWKIPDFESGAGDIKAVWEASRWDWVVNKAIMARKGSKREFKLLNQWLSNWAKQNPPYLGPNWKCAQEAAIRLIHLLLAVKILNCLDRPRAELLSLIEVHAARIAPTTSYAMSQANNHASSEGAALFLAGSYLRCHGVSSGRKWERKGRKILEWTTRKLVKSDGTFSQNSTNYHRLFLETICVVDLWRNWLELDRFSSEFYRKAEAATLWLNCAIESESGDVPNLGANDGARLLSFLHPEFRDFRPALEIAFCSFFGKSRFPCSVDPVLIDMFGLKANVEYSSEKRSVNFREGGYTSIRRGDRLVFLRHPTFFSRPRQCDVLHVDVWDGCNNIFRDSGTYSYNDPDGVHEYFTSTAAHNVIAFDDHDQMPKVGRFLRGKWLSGNVEYSGLDTSCQWIKAEYVDWMGCQHSRNIFVEDSQLLIIDDVSGFRNKAVLRWHVKDIGWKLIGNTLKCDAYTIRIDADVPTKRIEIKEAPESRYYLNKCFRYALEVEFNMAAKVHTILQFE